MEPTRLRYRFNGPGVYYLDLARDLSATNRKFTSQFQDFTCAGGLIKDSNNESVLEINVAPRVWSTRTALRRGKKMFDKMNNDVMKDTGTQSIKPKYYDYKVFLDQGMVLSNIVDSQDAAGNDRLLGTWDYSNYVSEDVDWANLGSATNRAADQFQAMIVGNDHVGTGGNWTKIGLIYSWLGTRPQVDDEPDTISSNVTSDPLVNLFDESDADDEIITRLRGDNQLAPYDKAYAPGAERPYSASGGANLQRVGFAATQTGAGQISALSGFKALCGLVQVVVGQATPGVVELLLDVMPKGESI